MTARTHLLAGALLLFACASGSDDDLSGNGAGVDGGNGGTPNGGNGGNGGNGVGPDAGDERDAGGVDNPLCRYGGQGSQAPGAACGCAADCAGEAGFCARDLQDPLGEGYCTQTCGDDESCPEGLECLTLGPVSFCQACNGGEPAGVDEPCACDSDCGTVEVGAQTRAMSCVGGRCAVTDCIPTTAIGCPEGQFCELRGLDAVCVTCLSEVPGGAGDPCLCQRDCGGSDIECRGGTCARRCATAADCDEGEECRVSILGNPTCVEPSPACTDTATRTLGAPCACNGDCASSAPVCLSTDLLGEVDLGFCTQRPCAFGDPEACVAETPIPFSCCRIPLVFPPTCLPDALAEPLSDVLTCD